MPVLKQLFRILARGAILALAWIAGCHFPMGHIMYGVAPPPHDPTVQIGAFSYTPASPIHVGDTLAFSATLNHATQAGRLEVAIGQPPIAWFMLLDDGMTPDAQANDGVYSGTLQWQPTYGPVAGQPVTLRLAWLDGYPGTERAAPPLTVEE